MHLLDVPSDGHCGFWCVAKALRPHATLHDIFLLRKALSHYYLTHAIPSFDLTLDRELSPLENARDSRHRWATSQDFHYLAHLLRVNIVMLYFDTHSRLHAMVFPDLPRARYHFPLCDRPVITIMNTTHFPGIHYEHYMSVQINTKTLLQSHDHVERLQLARLI